MVKRHRCRTPSPVTGDPSIERSCRGSVESEEDEDLNKCRDLLASDDGCDPVRRGKQPWRIKRRRLYIIRREADRERERERRKRVKSNEKTRMIGIGLAWEIHTFTKDR